MREHNIVTFVGISQLEADLREADEWKAKYEQRWGLDEAVMYQNQLKNQLQIQDDQISKLNYDISAAQVRTIVFVVCATCMITDMASETHLGSCGNRVIFRRWTWHFVF